MGSGTTSQARRPPSRDRLCRENHRGLFANAKGWVRLIFSDLTHIDLAYSTTGDGEHEIQVYANFFAQ